MLHPPRFLRTFWNRLQRVSLPQLSSTSTYSSTHLPLLSCRCVSWRSSREQLSLCTHNFLHCALLKICSVGEMDAPRSLRILFCGSEFPGAEHHTRLHLKKYPHLHMEAWPREDVPVKIAEFDICVPRMTRIDAAIIGRAKRLKLIVQFGVGLEGVDVEAATKGGIKVARIPSGDTGNALSCAEHAIYLIFGLLRNQAAMALAMAERRLGVPTGETLHGKTVFILGYGDIGRELALRLRVFGVHIVACKRSWTGIFSSNDLYHQDRQMEETLSRSDNGDDLVHEKGGTEHILTFASRADIIVTCCTLNPTTKEIVNAKFLSTMKKGARIVNVARGGLLDYNAVVKALESGQLGGLAMDVAWSEPYDPSDPILKFPNVLITPHVAGVTTLSYANMGQAIAESAHQLSIGAPMTALDIVN